jgi:hypothetical protein
VTYAIERASYDMVFTLSRFRHEINFRLNNLIGFSVGITDGRDL